MEVDEKGKFWPLIAVSCGKVRARFRNSISKPEFPKPGRIYAYTIDLWHTGFTIQPGHRLRIEVASADFPMFERNLNTGGNNETETKFVPAKQAIYHDAKHPSHILLPMIPEK
jgi:putative CocE/NonD family hydrolase